MEHLGNSWLVSSILSYGLSVNPEAEKNIFYHHFPENCHRFGLFMIILLPGF
jgi:hypothetical protein